MEIFDKVADGIMGGMKGYRATITSQMIEKYNLEGKGYMEAFLESTARENVEASEDLFQSFIEDLHNRFCKYYLDNGIIRRR